MLLIATTSRAQEAVISETIRELDGKKYYVHVVEKGNTIYGISKLYNTELEDILELNPTAKEGIGIGQELLIPFKKSVKKKADVNELKMDGSFLVHTVSPKETIYSISKKYDIPAPQLIRDNPILKEGLKIGQELRIQTTRERRVDIEIEKVKTVFVPAVRDSLVHHIVEAKQTLYSLAKQYNVNMDSIRIVNGGLPKGLQTGQVLRIPKIREDYIRFKYNPKADSLFMVKKQRDSNEVHLYLFLPLHLDLNDTSFTTKEEGGLFFRNQIHARSRIAFEFYEGVRLAVDSITKLGKKVHLHVFDTRTNDFDSTLAKISFVDADMIIGPFYRSTFGKVSPLAKKYGIPIVTPVPQSNKILLDNPVVIKLTPSTASEVRYLSRHYKRRSPYVNALVINSNKYQDKALVNMFRSLNDSSYTFDTTKIVEMYNIDTTRITGMLDSTINFVYVPSTDQSFVTQLVNSIQTLTENYDITVFAPGKWMGYDNLNLDYLNALNMHFATPYFVDYSDTNVTQFLARYRDRYGTEPGKYGFLGYELIMQFTKFESNHLMQEIENIDYQGMVINYDFKHYDFKNGFENQGMHLIRIEDFEYKKVQ